MKKKYILLGLIVLSLLSIIFVGRYVLSSESHAGPSDALFLYNRIKEEAMDNGKGAKYEGEHADAFDYSGTKDIYYYQDKDYSNVRLGNYCWQILRTTDTGGIKLIYNGVHTDNNKCATNNSTIGSSQYNDNNVSLAHVGYMYNPDTLVEYVDSTRQNGNSLTGNDVIYENGQYTLINTSTTIDNNHHYSCNNLTGTCETVRYYYNYIFNDYYYIELTDGRSIEDAVYDMLYADDVNKEDSVIKAFIDNWYLSNMMQYNDLLEDTVFCNDRSIINADTSGLNKNGDLSIFTNFKNSTLNSDLSCKNETDRFSTANDKAKLTFKVGLPTAPEMNLLNKDFRKISGPSYWLGTPHIYGDCSAYARPVWGSTGDIDRYTVDGQMGVRPVISLKADIRYLNGIGTETDPYVIDTRPRYNIVTDVENGEINETNVVIEGESITIRYTAKEGFKLKSLLIDEIEMDITLYPGEYTFANVDKDHSVKVIYEKIPQEPEQPIVEPEPTEPVTPVKEDKPITPKTEEKVVEPVKRSTTPNTVDKIIIDSELFVISVLVMGICIMLIKRIK